LRVGRLTPVGLFPRGNTPEGGADLAGNIWEWTASDYESGGKVLRGGSWVNGSWVLHAGYRDRFRPDVRVVNVGFRCVRE
jgi:formylglycine-generating enzyme required for sulfatase activity